MMDNIDNDDIDKYQKWIETGAFNVMSNSITKEQLNELLEFCKKPMNSLYWKMHAIRLVLYIRKQNESEVTDYPLDDFT